MTTDPEVRGLIERTISVGRNYLARSNPTHNMPEDDSQQWQALEHQFDLLEAALERLPLKTERQNLADAIARGEHRTTPLPQSDREFLETIPPIGEPGSHLEALTRPKPAQSDRDRIRATPVDELGEGLRERNVEVLERFAKLADNADAFPNGRLEDEYKAPWLQVTVGDLRAAAALRTFLRQYDRRYATPPIPEG